MLSVISALVLCALLLLACSARACARINACAPLARAGDVLADVAHRHYRLLFVLIFAFGVGVRLFRFGMLPRGVNQDGAWAAVEALCLLRDGTDHLGVSLPTYFGVWDHAQMSTLYSYLLVPFIALFGLTRITMRMPMLIVSIAAMPLFYALAKRVAGRTYALIALLFLAICPWHIIQSRWALEANLFPHVLLLGMYLLSKGCERKGFLYAAMPVLGLCVYAYGVAAYIVPFILLLCAVLFVRAGKASVRQIVVCALIYLAVSGPFYMTMAINAFGWDTMHLGPFTMPAFPESERANDLTFTQENPVQAMLGGLVSVLRVVLLQEYAIYHLHNTIPAYEFYYKFSSILLIPGIILAVQTFVRQTQIGDRQDVKRIPLGLVLAWAASLIFYGAITVKSNGNRVNAFWYPLFLCCSYALYWMVHRVRAFAYLLAFIYAISFVGFSNEYYRDSAYTRAVAHAFYNGVYDALNYAENLPCERYYCTLSVGNPETKNAMEGQVMLAHEIDAAQRAGERPILGADGEEYIYQERYAYVDMRTLEIDPSEPAVYIVEEYEMELFDPAYFEIRPFSYYAVVWPRT